MAIAPDVMAIKDATRVGENIRLRFAKIAHFEVDLLIGRTRVLAIATPYDTSVDCSDLLGWIDADG